MISRIARTAAFVTLALLFHVVQPKADAPDNKDFAAKIAEIDYIYTVESQYSILEFDLLFAIDEFNVLVDQGDRNVDDCLQFLSESQHSYQQRTIAMLSMRALSLPRFVAFANGVLDLNNRHLMTNDEVMSAILPAYRFSTVALDNFLDRDVRRILYRMKGMKGLDKAYYGAIDDVLYGAGYFVHYFIGNE